MTADKFIEACVQSGYGNKAAANKYVKDNPKEEYSDDDFIALYHTSDGWSGVKRMQHLHKIGNGSWSTCFSGIMGNSSIHQDWV